MKKLLFGFAFLLILASCTGYQHQVAKDCSGSNPKEGELCISQIPPYIEQYAAMMEKDTMALFQHMKFIVEDDAVHWVYRMDSGKLKIDSRYMTPNQENQGTTLLWIGGCLSALALIIIIFYKGDAVIKNYSNLYYERVKAAQKEVIAAEATRKAAKEMQDAAIEVGSKESDLIARQAMLLDELTAQNDKLLEDAKEYLVKSEADQKFVDFLHFLCNEIVNTPPGKSRTAKRSVLADHILKHFQVPTSES